MMVTFQLILHRYFSVAFFKCSIVNLLDSCSSCEFVCSSIFISCTKKASSLFCTRFYSYISDLRGQLSFHCFFVGLWQSTSTLNFVKIQSDQMILWSFCSLILLESLLCCYLNILHYYVQICIKCIGTCYVFITFHFVCSYFDCLVYGSL